MNDLNDMKSFSLGGNSKDEAEKKFYSDVDSMRRQKEKGKLFDDASAILGNVARQKKVFITLGRFGKKFMNLTVKQTYKDYKRSLCVVNKKIPVGIELATYKDNKDGTYKVTDDVKGKIENVIPDKKLRKEKKVIEEPNRLEVLDFTENLGNK